MLRLQQNIQKNKILSNFNSSVTNKILLNISESKFEKPNFIESWRWIWWRRSWIIIIFFKKV